MWNTFEMSSESTFNPLPTILSVLVVKIIMQKTLLMEKFHQSRTKTAIGNSNPLKSTTFSTSSPRLQLQTLKSVQCQLKDPVLSQSAK